MSSNASDANNAYVISEEPVWDKDFIEHVVATNICSTMLSPTDFTRPFFLRIVLPAYRLSLFC